MTDDVKIGEFRFNIHPGNPRLSCSRDRWLHRGGGFNQPKPFFLPKAPSVKKNPHLQKTPLSSPCLPSHSHVDPISAGIRAAALTGNLGPAMCPAKAGFEIGAFAAPSVAVPGSTGIFRVATGPGCKNRGRGPAANFAGHCLAERVLHTSLGAGAGKTTPCVLSLWDGRRGPKEEKTPGPAVSRKTLPFFLPTPCHPTGKHLSCSGTETITMHEENGCPSAGRLQEPGFTYGDPFLTLQADPHTGTGFAKSAVFSPLLPSFCSPFEPSPPPIAGSFSQTQKAFPLSVSRYPKVTTSPPEI